MILGLSFMTHWQFKKFNQSLTDISLPKIEIPEMELEEFLLPEKEGMQEWISPDGKLRFSYPSTWLKIEGFIENTDFLNALNEQLASEGAEILFLAQKTDIKDSSFAFMVVQKIMIKEDKKNLEEIIRILTEGIKNEETSAEITAKQIAGDEARLEIDYKRTGGALYHSIKKIILRENIIYTIEVFSLKDGWQKIEAEARNIIGTFRVSE